MRQLKITKQITQRDGESISRYFQEINKYPMISADEEVDLAIRIHNGDSAALEQLVVANLRFVVSVAKQYQNQGLAFSDLINEGNLGLVKAAQRFDETRGFKFISYAVWWIRQSISQAISEQTRIVRLPLNRLATIKKISAAVPYLEQSLEREPSDEEVGAYLDLPNEELFLVNRIRKRQVSFDAPLSQREDSDLSLYDIIQTGSIPSPDDHLMKESVSENIKAALNKLTQREAKIITMTYGLGNTQVHSLHDIALTFNMSSERIRQIRSKCLIRLKKF
jgi:RNA polymerase primary sigma factor